MRALFGCLLASLAITIAFASCPDGWHRFEQKCFLFNQTVVHSKYNKELCDSHNSTMVTIHSPAENEFLRRLLFIHYDAHKWVWLARARNYNRTHGFLWSDKSAFNYSNWVAPEMDCTACCEIGLMQSGHWYGSHCNTWTFMQLCQKILPNEDHDDLSASGYALGDNFYLNQFGGRDSSQSVDPADIRPNVSELVEWLAYEVEAVREDLHQINVTNGDRIALEEQLYDRDSYLLTLLSLTVTLLLLVLVSVVLSYYMLVRKMRQFGSFCDRS